MNENERNPVFIHGGFRTSSTWLWSRFRRDIHFWCYYEIFNSVIPFVDFSNFTNFSPKAWNSRHPKSEPYYLEYLPLLPDSGRLSFFPVENQRGESFTPAGGISAPLDQVSNSYVAHLIDFARSDGKQPVLTCTGMLAKVAGLKSEFGGIHILLVRNLFSQWNSYSGQQRNGTSFFMIYLFDALRFARDDPFLLYLKELSRVDEFDSADEWSSRDRYDDAFCIFIAFHVYLLVNAARYCDIVIDCNRLASEPDGYRKETESMLTRLIGHHVDLSGARESIDCPQYMIANPARTRFEIERLARQACVESAASADEQQMVSSMLEDLWRKHEQFVLFGRAAFEQFDKARSDIGRLQRENEQLKQQQR
ncbi:hypothetical protein [Paraburkholderia adhaesiva]|uniref:hypothetical protein n=1 Tax=Paraburkholderia adhaesiva TaxID=2883244 RepID=UPI001F211274|nr:hypothetical protein [Paraburkholderia adhaesiva]